jgi:ABC-type nitrate/sulfonate/bicarbonate transport system substrate-binding protein
MSLRLAGFLFSMIFAIPALAQAPRSLEVIVFAGGSNWPIWVAQEKGLFAANGLAVKLTPTPNSVFLVTALMEGKFDIAMSTFDNVVAYQEGQGEAALPSPPDLFSFMGGLSGALRFMVAPDIKSYADLKGKTLGVDAATTGYAFIMYKLLQMNGLGADDYKLEKAGGTAFRVQAMLQGKVAGTMVNSPLDIGPEAQGYRRIGDTTESFGAYQAISGVARRAWAEKNGDRLVSYIRAYVAAVDWLYDPANRGEALTIYQKYVPNTPLELAGKAYSVMLSGNQGFQPRAKLDVDGVRTVLKVRSEFALPKKPLADPFRYFDESYYQRALQK